MNITDFIENYQSSPKTGFSLWCLLSHRHESHAMHPSRCISPLSQADTNYGALRTTLRCARISPVALPDLCNYKRSERPSPHSRLPVTRGLHVLVFDTPSTLASGKLQPRPHVSWSGSLKPRPDDARPHCWDFVLHSTEQPKEILKSLHPRQWAAAATL
jgi:hypothetical protein